MSDNQFEQALCSLGESQSSSTLLKILLVVRNEVEWPKNKDNVAKIREKQCVKHLVGCLHAQRKTILNVTLSILGNCIMDRGFARDAVGTYNILSQLNQIIKLFPKEDSINGRLFRIIGNMCQHKDRWAHTVLDKKPKIVTHIVDYIKKVSKDKLPGGERVSEATIMMAIRALRVLLNSHTIVPLVKTFEVLKAVGSLFIKYSLEWQENKSKENLLSHIIRLFETYSRYEYYYSITELRNTDRGDSIIHLSNVLVLEPKRIIQIVMNFLKITQLKSELPIPEICDTFIEVLSKYRITKKVDGDCIQYLQCLHCLLEHPANRDSERGGKSIPVLIQLLREYDQSSNKSLECCILLVKILNLYRYDANLLLKQLKCTIIQVLTMKLQWMVGKSNIVDSEHQLIKKRKHDIGRSSGGKRRSPFKDTIISVSPEVYSPPSSDDDILLLKYLYNHPNPSPCACYRRDSDLPYLWSTSLTCQSFMDSFMDSGSDSDNYSPVCSEADNTEFPLPVPEEEPLSNSEYPSEAIEFEEKPATENINNKTVSLKLKTRLLQEITQLLKIYTEMRPCVIELASEELLIALLNCSGYFECTFAFKVDTIDIICRILESHDYLIPLMQTEFIHKIYSINDVHHHKWCSKCSNHLLYKDLILTKFTLLAESNCGKGYIAHKLIKGDSNTKNKLVLVIPYIVRNQYILGKLMLYCGGLEILMKLLQDETPLKEKSINALCIMASQLLNIANPKDISVRVSDLDCPKIVADKYKLNENCTNIVTFKLDDGTFVEADRNFLSEKSDFFNKLLNGDFKESRQDVISLPNVGLKPLHCLLHLLICVDTSSMVEIDLDLETLLEVILLSDMYLMSDLCIFLMDCVEKFKISSKTVPIIYRWSIESCTNLLRVESIAFALVEKIVDAERFTMFEDLFNLGYSKQLVEDLKSLLQRYLTSSMVGHKSYQIELQKRDKNICDFTQNLLKPGVHCVGFGEDQ